VPEYFARTGRGYGATFSWTAALAIDLLRDPTQIMTRRDRQCSAETQEVVAARPHRDEPHACHRRLAEVGTRAETAVGQLPEAVTEEAVKVLMGVTTSTDTHRRTYAVPRRFGALGSVADVLRCVVRLSETASSLCNRPSLGP
jgi:hypothetical protein